MEIVLANLSSRRACGECNLCCKLLPVKGIGKPANTRCEHQRFKKGCAVYNRPGMPIDCKVWNCRWLVDDDTGDLPRPDRAHYVIDVMPDFVTVTDNDNPSIRRDCEVIQIWCDPAHPNAHHDPRLRAYLIRRGEEGKIGLIRYGSHEGIALIPPNLSYHGRWEEIRSQMSAGPAHTPEQVARALAGRA